MNKISLEEYILSNNGFLNKLASYYSNVIDIGIEYEDLYQVGCLALVESYNNYNVKKGSLSTYSYLVIRGAMLNYINSNNCVTHVPRPLSVLLNNVSKKKSIFYRENGRNMTDEEVLEYINNNNFTNYKSNSDLVKILDKISQYHIVSKCFSLYEPLHDFIDDIYSESEQNDLLIESFLKHDYNLEDEVMADCFILDVVESLRGEDKKSIDIFMETLGLIDGIPKVRGELAEKYSISKQAIDLRYKKTLSKVRKKFSSYKY